MIYPSLLAGKEVSRSASSGLTSHEAPSPMAPHEASLALHGLTAAMAKPEYRNPSYERTPSDAGELTRRPGFGRA